MRLLGAHGGRGPTNPVLRDVGRRARDLVELHDFYTAEFSRAGFRGGLNWYRNIDRNWDLTASLAGARVAVPALYIGGDRDLVIAGRSEAELKAGLASMVPNSNRRSSFPGVVIGRSKSDPKT